MIKEIKIENFKSIASLNLELGRLNVFIGANGSGKSNILEAISVGQATLENKLDGEFLFARGVRVLDDSYTASMFELNNDKPIVITFKNEEQTTVEIYKGGWEIREPFDTTDQPIETIQDKNRIKSGKFNRANKPQPFLIYAPENTYLRNFVEEGQMKPLGVRGEGLFNHLIKIFKEKPAYFDKINEYLKVLDWFEGVEIPQNLIFTERRLDFKDSNLAVDYIDQRSVNEGALYLLFYFTIFMSDKTPKFFAIDNIDNAMNPKLGSKLIKILTKLAKEHDKQTILTTHNPSVLDGLDLKDDEQRLFVIYRNADGHTKTRRITSKEVPNGIESVRLSEAFIRGYIGGLPKNF
jgi:AAA15 family ATPase/GTPase